MKKLLVLTTVLFSLSGCSDEKPTQESLVSALQASGVEINDVRELERDNNFPLPNSYSVNFAFSIPKSWSSVCL